ncbi:MAG: magnesium transporter [Promethearchaeota archaeon]
MDYFKKICKESVIIVILSSIIGIFSGSVLSTSQRILYSFPIILLILPALNSLTGDIATVLVSRLTTHLYIGVIPPKVRKSKRLIDDFIGLLLALLLSLIALIIIGYGVGIITGIQIVNPFLIISIMTTSVLILFVFMFILLFISSIIIFKRGKDPNNFLIPFITSLADFLTPLLLIIFIQIFI